MANKQEIMKYWIDASKQDYSTADVLFSNKRYQHALFFCHLSIEKLLKAIIIKTTNEAPPLIHDLVRLAEKASLIMNNNQLSYLVEISTFNIAARYDDIKLSFTKKADKRFTEKYIKITKEILKWLKQYV